MKNSIHCSPKIRLLSWNVIPQLLQKPRSRNVHWPSGHGYDYLTQYNADIVKQNENVLNWTVALLCILLLWRRMAHLMWRLLFRVRVIPLESIQVTGDDLCQQRRVIRDMLTKILKYLDVMFFLLSSEKVGRNAVETQSMFNSYFRFAYTDPCDRSTKSAKCRCLSSDNSPQFVNINWTFIWGNRVLRNIT